MLGVYCIGMVTRDKLWVKIFSRIYKVSEVTKNDWGCKENDVRYLGLTNVQS